MVSDHLQPIGCRKGPQLPEKDGFWNQEVVMSRNRFYMLQNVVHTRDPKSVMVDQRRLLEFEPREEVWSVINLS